MSRPGGWFSQLRRALLRNTPAFGGPDRATPAVDIKINITVTGGLSHADTVRRIGEAIGREVRSTERRN